MYVRILLCALLVTPFIATAPADAQGGLRFSILVHKFDNEVTNWRGQYDLGDSWRTIMTAALGENDNFIVVGEYDMRDAAMAEQAFGASGATVQGHKTPQRGKMTPAQLLVKGVITHFEQGESGGSGGVRFKKIKIGGGKQKTIVRASVYVVDSATGAVVASKNFEGDSQKRNLNLKFWNRDGATDLSRYDNDSTADALLDAVNQTIDWIAGRLPSIIWRGEIVLVKENTILVNRGSREGVRAGETFVAGETTILTDPDTGEVLDHDIAEQARLKVDRVKEKIAYCKVISGDASLLYEGMGIARVGS